VAGLVGGLFCLNEAVPIRIEMDQQPALQQLVIRRRAGELRLTVNCPGYGVEAADYFPASVWSNSGPASRALASKRSSIKRSEIATNHFAREFKDQPHLADRFSS
jgi:hypothetical protein